MVDEDGFFEETIVDVCFVEVLYVVISFLVEVSVCDNLVPDVTGILELEKCNSVLIDEILEDVKVEKDVVGYLVEIVETITIVCGDVDIRENELEVLMIIGASVDNETWLVKDICDGSMEIERAVTVMQHIVTYDGLKV